MPFPLFSLDYGTRCRLRQLVTPAEAYDLQIAAPHLDSLKPIQSVQSTFAAKISTHNNELTVKLTSINRTENDLAQDELYTITALLDICDIPVTLASRTARIIVNHFKFNDVTVRFYRCGITSDVIREIFRGNTCNCLRFENCTFEVGFKSALTPKALFVLIKRVQYIIFENGCPFEESTTNYIFKRKDFVENW
uniref:Recep_L_domain domain-containing protein n=1 Tax=Panagrellus redivivus TaxID=6233 RepID=A0A7E4VKD2_PANRE